jgi:hypothetical protein
LRFVRQQPQHDALLQAANFLPETWDPAQAPVQYRPGCLNNVYPCSNANRRALDPISGELLPTLAIGQLVANSGNEANGMFVAGQGISKTAYNWPVLALAPRFGMAYDVSGTQSLVLRGGGGLFYDRPQGTTIYGLITNPPITKSVTVNFGQLQSLGSSGLALSGTPNMAVYEYDAPLPSSAQWNAGMQLALPWSSALDVSYVGQHGFNLLQNVNINLVDLGTAFLLENQDPTRAPSGTPGATALPTELLRYFQGYGNINYQWGRGWTTYHSVQTSFNRRFTGGVSFGLNHTLGLSNRGNAGARLEHGGDGNFRYRADQAEADELLGQLQLQRHTIKGTFVWDLPDMQADGVAMRAVALVANDWQLSGVASYQSGSRYTIGYSYQNGGGNVNITGSPNYGGRVIITGDPGSGCSSNQYRQFNTEAFAGPPVGSVGLESGQNYMTGCWERFWDMALARNIRLGGSRQVQIRAEVFNVFNTVVYTGRQTNMNLQSPTDQTLRNPQYDADGNVISTRLTWSNAGFGAVNNAAALRTVQLQVRFQF